MGPLVRTARAEEDLVEIWLTIADDNPAAADRMLDRIEQRCQQLTDHPLSGVARSDIGPGIRHLLAGAYLILYRVAEDCVEIVRVMHGRRDIRRSDIVD